MRQGERGLELEGRAERGFGLGQVAQLFVEPAQVQVGRAGVGLDLKRGQVVVAGLGPPAGLLQSPAQRDMRARPSGAEGQHPLPAGNRLAGLFHLVVELGQPFPVGGVGRLQLDGLLQPDQGVGELALALQHKAEVGVGRGEVRVQPQCFQVRGPGVDQPVQHPQHVAEIVVQHRRIRIEPDRLLTVRQRFLGLAAIQQRLAEVGLGRRRMPASIATARRKCSSASSVWPSSRRAMPRLLWATAKSGRSSSARRSCSTDSACCPSPSRAAPRLQSASG